MASETPAKPHSFVNLDTLNPDVLSHIFLHLATDDPWAWFLKSKAVRTRGLWAQRLLPLSLMSKRLRAYAMPWVFHDLWWPGSRAYVSERMGEEETRMTGRRVWARYPDIPPEILVYVKHLIILTEKHYAPANLISCIPLMTSLLRVTIDMKHAPPPALLAALPPNLLGLHFHHTPLPHAPSPIAFPHLSHLALLPSAPATRTNAGLGTFRSGEFALENLRVSALPVNERLLRAWKEKDLDLVAARGLLRANVDPGWVRSLEIDLGLLDWGAGAAMRGWKWDTLEKLVLRGETPLFPGDNEEGGGLLTRLPSTPCLVELHLLLTPSPLPAPPSPQTPTPFLLLPSASLSLPILFPALQSLMLSNPSPSDRLFHPSTLLPTNLHTLCFPSVSQGKKEGAAGLPVPDALKVLGSLKGRRGQGIRRLEVVLKEGMATQILDGVVDALPGLVSLRIGTGMYERRGKAVDVESLTRTLAPLTHLRHLSLALTFRANGRDGCFGPDEEETACALYLARHLLNSNTPSPASAPSTPMPDATQGTPPAPPAQGRPRLHTISLQSLASFGNLLDPRNSSTWAHWTRYDVVEGGSGVDGIGVRFAGMCSE